MGPRALSFHFSQASPQHPCGGESVLDVVLSEYLHKSHNFTNSNSVLPTDAFNLNSKFLKKKGASPCAGKHSCTSSKKLARFKSFF